MARTIAHNATTKQLCTSPRHQDLRLIGNERRLVQKQELAKRLVPLDCVAFSHVTKMNESFHKKRGEEKSLHFPGAGFSPVVTLRTSGYN